MSDLIGRLPASCLVRSAYSLSCRFAPPAGTGGPALLPRSNDDLQLGLADRDRFGVIREYALSSHGAGRNVPVNSGKLVVAFSRSVARGRTTSATVVDVGGGRGALLAGDTRPPPAPARCPVRPARIRRRTRRPARAGRGWRAPHPVGGTSSPPCPTAATPTCSGGDPRLAGRRVRRHHAHRPTGASRYTLARERVTVAADGTRQSLYTPTSAHSRRACSPWNSGPVELQRLSPSCAFAASTMLTTQL